MNMTSQEAKVALMGYYMSRNFAAVATEFSIWGGIADLFAVDRAFMGTEVEVKCSKSDLDSELKAVRYFSGEQKMVDLFEAWQQKDYLERKGQPLGNKHTKHSYYLTNQTKYGNLPSSIPNKFYFAVPEDLVKYALPFLEPTPYGLIKLLTYDVVVVRRAKYLHKTPVEQKFLSDFLRKATNENLNLRRELLTHNNKCKFDLCPECGKFKKMLREGAI